MMNRLKYSSLVKYQSLDCIEVIDTELYESKKEEIHIGIGMYHSGNITETQIITDARKLTIDEIDNGFSPGEFNKDDPDYK